MKLNKSVSTLIGSCALITLLTGCSSIICGPRQSLSISSKPAGAEVLVYNPQGDIVFQDTTPCVASLTRSTPEENRANYIVLIRKEGFAPVQIPLTSRLNKAYLANVLFGGVGLIVDPLTGSMWTLRAEGLDAELVDQSAASFHDTHDFTILLKEQPAQDLVAHVAPTQDQSIPLESLTRAVRNSNE
jgi:hypothetical protein